jgi:hypothetical protein
MGKSERWALGRGQVMETGGMGGRGEESSNVGCALRHAVPRCAWRHAGAGGKEKSPRDRLLVVSITDWPMRRHRSFQIALHQYTSGAIVVLAPRAAPWDSRFSVESVLFVCGPCARGLVALGLWEEDPEKEEQERARKGDENRTGNAPV